MTDIISNRNIYIRNFLDKASEAYYNGNPIISDEQFDYLCSVIGYKAVGYSVKNIDTKLHYSRMYSLQKHYAGEGLNPLKDYSKPKVESPKLDGAAISLLYHNGQLIQALTRGDGIEGRDITEKFLYSAKVIVPKSIQHEDLLQVTGEVTTLSTITNARNYAAGALNLIDLNEFNEKDLYFTAYDLSPYSKSIYSEELKYLETLGFKTVLDKEWCSRFQTDGTVIRINSNQDYLTLGFTAKHPRGAYALKERKEGAISRILDVEWNTGKSGKVTPVAILEPCVIGGAKISRATLNNVGFIKSLNLDIGDYVEVQRSGDIIPTIVRKIE